MTENPRLLLYQNFTSVQLCNHTSVVLYTEQMHCPRSLWNIIPLIEQYSP